MTNFLYPTQHFLDKFNMVFKKITVEFNIFLEQNNNIGIIIK